MADKTPNIYEHGMSGLNFTLAGTVEEEYLPQLRGREAIRVYKEMSDNDPVVASIIFAIIMLLRQVEWYPENHPDAKDDAGKNFLQECMDDMSHSWPDFISEVVSMIIYGWSLFEIVYKVRNGPLDGSTSGRGSKYKDGKIGWRKFAGRSQDSLDRWIFDDSGGIAGFCQKPPPRYEDIVIPIEKCLLFRTSTYKSSPEGRSVLRAAYRPWYYKKRFEEIQGVGIERDLAGIPFAEVDPAILSTDATPQQRAMLAAIENIVKNARQGTQAGIIWPNVYNEQGHKLFDFKLLTSGGSRSFDINAVIQNCDQRIAMTVLADFILLGHENVGSFALSSDKTNLFTVALGAWLTSIEDVLNRYAVPRLFAMNGMDLATIPRIKHGDIEKPDMVQLASFLATITSIGMPTFPDPNLEQFVRKAAGLPEPTEQATNAFKQKEEQELQAIIQQLAEQGDFPPQMQSVLMASGLVEPDTFDQEDEEGEPPPEGEEPMPFEEV